MSEIDPTFATRRELEAWIRQRCRYPDPALDARLTALADIRRVTLAHAHLLSEDPRNPQPAQVIDV